MAEDPRIQTLLVKVKELEDKVQALIDAATANGWTV